MKHTNSTDMQRFIENAIGDLELVEPPATLDSKIRNLVNDPSGDQAAIVVPCFSWPAFVATALSACLLGILMGRLSVEPESTELLENTSPPVVAALLPENDNLPTQTLASTNVKLEGFGLLHGHSGQAEFSDCSTCHRVTPKEKNPHFYDRKSLRGIRVLMNCKSCHVIEGFWNG